MQMHKSSFVQINAFCVARQMFRYIKFFFCLYQSLWFFFITCIAYRRIKSLEIIKHENGVLKWKRILPLSLTSLLCSIVDNKTTRTRKTFISIGIELKRSFHFTVNKSDMFVIYFARYKIIQ